ncbi:phosphonate metabolism transcriptional regulator PhnF [Microbacteriaceae bacterium K1510]|nr:phosphonate metabolism transcriptional regulator PhnF [Microbacteriaceae bacterium K1510]
MTSEGASPRATLNPQSPRRPLWRQIQDVIERRINEGAYPPGEQLPTEEELARQFQVHRHTVRRAIERLRDKQAVRVEQGRGIFVREPAVSYRIGRNTRFTIAALRDDRRPMRRVLSSTRVKANRTTSAGLALPLDHPVQRVNMVRMVDDRVISVASCYYPLPRFQDIDKFIRETGSITEAMRRFGVEELPRKTLRVSAVMPTESDAKLLNVSRSKPLLELMHVNLDQHGVPVQAVHSRFVSAWIDLVIDF